MNSKFDVDQKVVRIMGFLKLSSGCCKHFDKRVYPTSSVVGVKSVLKQVTNEYIIYESILHQKLSGYTLKPYF